MKQAQTNASRCRKVEKTLGTGIEEPTRSGQSVPTLCVHSKTGWPGQLGRQARTEKLEVAAKRSRGWDRPWKAPGVGELMPLGRVRGRVRGRETRWRTRSGEAELAVEFGWQLVVKWPVNRDGEDPVREQAGEGRRGELSSQVEQRDRPDKTSSPTRLRKMLARLP